MAWHGRQAATLGRISVSIEYLCRCEIQYSVQVLLCKLWGRNAVPCLHTKVGGMWNLRAVSEGKRGRLARCDPYDDTSAAGRGRFELIGQNWPGKKRCVRGGYEFGPSRLNIEWLGGSPFPKWTSLLWRVLWGRGATCPTCERGGGVYLPPLRLRFRLSLVRFHHNLLLGDVDIHSY